jgi:hypothetical protein
VIVVPNVHQRVIKLTAKRNTHTNTHNDADNRLVFVYVLLYCQFTVGSQRVVFVCSEVRSAYSELESVLEQ